MTSNIRRNPSEDTLYDEAAPLLVGEYDDLEIQKPIGYISPIPKYQLAAICFVRLADPVAFTQVPPLRSELETFSTTLDIPVYQRAHTESTPYQ